MTLPRDITWLGARRSAIGLLPRPSCPRSACSHTISNHHPHPGPPPWMGAGWGYRVDTSCGSPDGAISSPSPPFRGRAIAFGETVAFLSVIPAQAGIQRPKTRHLPLDSRLRGNDGNREVAEPICDSPALDGAGARLRAISALRPAAVPGMTAETPIGLVERSSCLSTPIPLAIFIENM